MTQLETIPQKASTRKPNVVGVSKFTCSNHIVHNVKVVKYDDESIWITCPLFGWYMETELGKTTLKLGCAERKKRCTWYISTH